MSRELASGAYALARVDAHFLNEAYDLVERYRDQDIGVADAPIVVLAQRWNTRRLLTFDRGHFGVLRTSAGDPFELVP